MGGKSNENNSPPAEISRWRIELDGGELFDFLIQINSPSSTQVSQILKQFNLKQLSGPLKSRGRGN